MVKLNFLLSLRTPAGRREARARRWDRIADRLAVRKDQTAKLIQLGIKVGVAGSVIDGLGAELGELVLAERNARDIAKTIRDGR